MAESWESVTKDDQEEYLTSTPHETRVTADISRNEKQAMHITDAEARVTADLSRNEQQTMPRPYAETRATADISRNGLQNGDETDFCNRQVINLFVVNIYN